MPQLTIFPLNDCRNCFFQRVFSRVTFAHISSPSDTADFEIVCEKWIPLLFPIFVRENCKLEVQSSSAFWESIDEQFSSITEEESVGFQNEFGHSWTLLEVEKSSWKRAWKGKRNRNIFEFYAILFHLIWFRWNRRRNGEFQDFWWKKRKWRKKIAASVNAYGEGTVREGEDVARSGVNCFEVMSDVAVCLCEMQSILWFVVVFCLTL
jgi:hypothetical protein